MRRVPLFLNDMFDGQVSEVVFKIIEASISTIKSCISQWEYGLKTKNIKDIKFAIHKMKPSLVHLDLGFIVSILKKNKRDIMRWTFFYKTHQMIFLSIQKFS